MAEVAIVPDEGGAFIGGSYTFVVELTNVGDDTGYGPYLELFLPAYGVDANDDGEVCDGVTFANAAALFTSPPRVPLDPNPIGGRRIFAGACGEIAGFGVASPAFAGCSLPTMPPGTQQVILPLPMTRLPATAGVAPPTARPQVRIEVTVNVHRFANHGESLPIFARGGFQFGNLPQGQTCTAGEITEAEVTPVVFALGKVYVPPIDCDLQPLHCDPETATGPGWPGAYEVTLAIADGQTLTGVEIIDHLASNVAYSEILEVEPPSLVVREPPMRGTGGEVALEYDQLSGGARFSFNFFIPERDEDGALVLDPSSCEVVPSVNELTVRATWTPEDPRNSEERFVREFEPHHQLNTKCLALRKSVEAQNGREDGLVLPGDQVRYVMEFAVSDFFSFGDLQITDWLSNGQRLDPQPALLLVQDADGSTSTLFDPANVTVDAPDCAAGGRSRIVFDVSQQLMDAQGTRHPTGVVSGTPGAGARGALVFIAIVEDEFRCPVPSGDTSVDKHDPLTNEAEIVGQAVGGAGSLVVTDNTKTGTQVAGDGIDKRVCAIRRYIDPETVLFDPRCLALGAGGDPREPSFWTRPAVAPGDRVTFRLRYPVPSCDFESLSIEDYPPPIFSVTNTSWSFDPTPPARSTDLDAGVASFGPGHRFPGALPPLVIPNGSDNSLRFDFQSFDDPNNEACTIEVLYTFTVGEEPVADGLVLTNFAVECEANSFGGAACQTALADLRLAGPKVRISKGVVQACCEEELSFGVGRLFRRICRPTGIYSQRPEEASGFSGTATGCPRFSLSEPITSKKIETSQDRVRQLLDRDLLADVDHDDVVTFAIVVENVGSGPNGVFDVRIEDTLPLDQGFELPNTRGLLLNPTPGHEVNLCVTDGTGERLPFTGRVDRDTQTLHVALTDPGDTETSDELGGALSARDLNSGTNLAIITYDLRVSDDLEIGECVDNTARVTSYAGVNGGSNHACKERVCEGLSPRREDDARVCRVPAATKSVVSSSEDFTFSRMQTDDTEVEELAIGEVLRFRIELQLLEGESEDIVVTDCLAPGLELIEFADPNDPSATVPATVRLLADAPLNSSLTGAQDGAITLPVDAQPALCGQQLTFDIGTIVNHDDDCDDEFVVVEFNALVLNTSENNEGDEKENRFEAAVSGATIRSNPVQLEIVEPKLTLAKTMELVRAATAEEPDLVHIEFVVENDADASTTAFEVLLEDTLPPCFENPQVVDIVRQGRFGLNHVVTGNVDNGVVRVETDFLLPDQALVVNVVAEVCPEAACASTRNDARVTYSSLPGSTPPFGANPTGSVRPGASGDDDGERDGLGIDPPNDYRASASAELPALCDFSAVLTIDGEIGCNRDGSLAATATLEILRGVGPYRCVLTSCNLYPRHGQVEDECDSGLTMPRDAVDNVCTYDGLFPGEYSYTVTDLTTRDEVQVQASLPLFVEVETLRLRNPSPPACNDGSITVGLTGPEAVPPFSFRWNPESLTSPMATRSDLTPGIYSVRVASSTGCSEVEEFELSCDCPDPEDAAVTYVSRDPAECTAPVNCPVSQNSNTVSFNDDCGCGCIRLEDSPRNWTFRLHGAAESSAGGVVPWELEDQQAGVHFELAAGVQASLEYALGDRFGLELGALYAEGNAELRAGSIVDERSGHFSLLSLGANYHLSRDRRLDLFVGPFLGRLRVPEPRGFEASADAFLGVTLGLDMPLRGGRFSFGGRVQYLDATIELSAPISGRRLNLDFDPWIVSFGSSIRF